MPKYDYELFEIKANLCKTLADPSRQMMIAELRLGEKTVRELSEAIEISQPVTSRHLAVLREGGVVKTRREGTSIYYSLINPKIAQACDIIHDILLSQMKKKKEFVDRIMS